MQAVASTSGGGFGVAIDQQDLQFGRTGHKVGGRARIGWNPLASLHPFLTASHHENLQSIVAWLHSTFQRCHGDFYFG